MLTLSTTPALDDRLAVIARRLGKSPEQCALEALTAWLECHEQAIACSTALGGDGVFRPADEFFD